jgi:hypothetical protein
VTGQVEQRTKALLAEEAVRTGEGGAVLGARPETVCTKQSATAYGCLSQFPSRPNLPNVITNVTSGRNGENCIMETS